MQDRLFNLHAYGHVVLLGKAGVDIDPTCATFSRHKAFNVGRVDIWTSGSVTRPGSKAFSKRWRNMKAIVLSILGRCSF